jgi:hypothetical protein
MFNYREGGLRQIGFKVKKVLARNIYNKKEMLIFASEFKNIPPPKLQLAVKSLTFSNLQNFEYIKALAFPEVIQDRFKKGEECFGFFLDSKLAHIEWHSPGYLGIFKPFPIIKIQKGSGIHDGTTMPQFRQKGVYFSAMCYLQGILQQRGKSMALAAVDPGHIVAQKGLLNAGFRYVYSLNYRRVFFIFISVWESKRNQIAFV